MLRFILTLVFVAGMLAFGVKWTSLIGWLENAPSFLYQITIFLVFATGIIYARLHKVSKPVIFVQFYLLTMALKILAYAVFIGLIILKDPSGAPANVTFFILAYGVFTSLEIAFLYHRITGNKTS